MNKDEVMKALDELYEDYADIIERLRDVKNDIERNGEFSYAEKGKLVDLRLSFDNVAYCLGNILRGVTA